MQSPPPGNLVLQGELSYKSLFPVTAPIVPILHPHSLRCLGLEALASGCNLVPADHRLLNQTNPSGRFGTAVFHGTKVPSTLNSGGRERLRGTGCSNAPALNGVCVRPAVGREAEKSHQCLIPQLRARLEPRNLPQAGQPEGEPGELAPSPPTPPLPRRALVPSAPHCPVGPRGLQGKQNPQQPPFPAAHIEVSGLLAVAVGGAGLPQSPVSVTARKAPAEPGGSGPILQPHLTAVYS